MCLVKKQKERKKKERTKRRVRVSRQEHWREEYAISWFRVGLPLVASGAFVIGSDSYRETRPCSQRKPFTLSHELTRVFPQKKQQTFRKTRPHSPQQMLSQCKFSQSLIKNHKMWEVTKKILGRCPCYEDAEKMVIRRIWTLFPGEDLSDRVGEKALMWFVDQGANLGFVSVSTSYKFCADYTNFRNIVNSGMVNAWFE